MFTMNKYYFIGGAVLCLALIVYAIWASGKRKKDK